jgi:hypothetical protein
LNSDLSSLVFSPPLFFSLFFSFFFPYGFLLIFSVLHISSLLSSISLIAAACGGKGGDEVRQGGGLARRFGKSGQRRWRSKAAVKKMDAATRWSSSRATRAWTTATTRRRTGHVAGGNWTENTALMVAERKQQRRGLFGNLGSSAHVLSVASFLVFRFLFGCCSSSLLFLNCSGGVV